MSRSALSHNLAAQTITVRASAAGLAAAAVVAVTGLAMTPQQAAARPKFTQQTGKACTYCHGKPPALNAAGKAFKAKGNKL